DMWRGTMQAVRSMEFANDETGRRRYVIESAPGHLGLLALVLPWEGSVAHADLMGRARHFSPLIAITRDGGEGRVRLTRAGRVRRDSRGSIIPGLYVADTSTFPTALGVNPMITVMAMARRVSRTVLAEGKSG